MKHSVYILKFAVALCVVILLFALTLLVKPKQVQQAEVETGLGMALQPPAFIKSANAAGLAQVDLGFLLEEAGITAYTKLEQEIDLESLKSRFKTIGRQTDQFISGTVNAPGYEKLPEFGESGEVQVFLHRNGWIVSYLTRYQTASSLFDWVSYDEKRLKDSTLIENVVRMLALDTGVSDFAISYYDFRNPTATNLMLVAEHADNNSTSDSFEITIPRELTVYESSWSYAQFSIPISSTRNVNYFGSCTLNDDTLASLAPGEAKWEVIVNTLSKAKFPLVTNHKIVISGNDVRNYCGIAIIYRDSTTVRP